MEIFIPKDRAFYRMIPCLLQFMTVFCADGSQCLLKLIILLEGNQLVDRHLFFDTESKKLPNQGLNSWSSLPGSYPPVGYYVMVRGLEHGKEDHEFDHRLDNFLFFIIKLFV